MTMTQNPETKKKTLGRRKIEIKTIQNKNNLQVTLCKRRTGIFKKAAELSLLTGAQIAIIVQSPSKKVFTFSNVGMDSVLNWFQTGSTPSFVQDSKVVQECRSEYEEAERRLMKEERRAKEVHGPENWWDRPVEGLGLYELEEYLEALEGLKSKVLKRVGEIDKLRLVEESGLNFEVGESSSKNLLGFDGTICCYEDLGGRLSEHETFDEVENTSSSNVINSPTEYQYSENNGYLEDMIIPV